MAISYMPHVPSTGQKAGEAVGGELSNVFKTIAHNKARQMEQKQIAKHLKSLNLPEQLAYVPKELAQQYMKNQSHQQQSSALAEAISGLTQGTEGNESPLQGALQSANQPTEEAEPFPNKIVGEYSPFPKRTEEQPKTPIKTEQPQSKGLTKEQLAKLTPQQQMQVANLELKRQSNEEKKKQLMSKQEIEAQKRQDRKQEHWDRETQPIYDETLLKGKGATDSDIRLSRIEELTENGNLSSPIFEMALKTIEEGLPRHVHLNLEALRSADSQELNKLSRDFLKDAKQYFGSRVTEGEIRLFLQTVPTLSQTKEGRLRIINNMRMFNELARERMNVMDSIIKENNGERPRNLGILIEQRVKPKADDIAKRFKLGIREGHKMSKQKGLLESWGIDNPMDIFNALSGAESGIKERASGLFGY